MLRVIIIIGLLSMASGGFSAVDKQVIYDAAGAYQRGDFSQAITQYQTAYDSGMKNGSLLFNLGNAYYKDGQIGMAISSYLKALDYIPRNADLKANLRYVLTKTKDSQEEAFITGNIQTMTLRKLLNLKELFYLAGGLWLLACVCLAYSFWNGHLRRQFQVVGAFLGMVGLVGLSMAVIRQQTAAKIGAVVVEEASVFASPSDKNSIVVFKLHEGAMVKLVKKELDWVAIEITGQKRGWLPASQLNFM